MAVENKRMWQRGALEADLLAADEVPADRELIGASDTGRVWLGDGVSPLSARPFLVTADPMTGQMPDDVRETIAANLADPTTPEGAAAQNVVGKPGPAGNPGSNGLGFVALDNPTYAVAVVRNGRAAFMIRHDGRVQSAMGTHVFDGDESSSMTAMLRGNGLSFAVVKNGRVGEMTLDLSGRFPKWVAEALVTRGKGVLPTAAPVGLAGWGDSITAGDGGANGYTQIAADSLGKAAYNGGWSGQAVDQIAARQGGVPAVMTFPSNTIPKSGSSTVTMDVNPVAPMNGQTVTTLRGAVQGIPGALTYDGTTFTFTRDTPGQFDVALNGGTKFVPENGTKYRAYDAVFWAGRNAAAGDVQKVVTMTRAMVDYHQIVNPRFLVLQVLPGDGWGDEKPLNWALSQEFPENYVRVADWLRTDDAAAAIGYTLTSDDRTDIAAGLTPRGYRLDPVHPNTTGRRAIAALITNEFTTRGWN